MLNLWDVALPLLETWLKNQVGVRATLKHLSDHVPELIQKSPHMYHLIYQLLEQQSLQVPLHTKPKQSISIWQRIALDIVVIGMIGIAAIYFQVT